MANPQAETHKILGLSELADILTWKQASGTPALWCACYEDLLEDELQSLAEENDEALCVADALALLARPRRRAFLRAPLVASRLLSRRKGEPFNAGPVVKSLMAELAAAGIDCDLFEPVWTVLGDRCIAPAAAVPRAAPIPDTDVVIDHSGPIDFSARQGSRLVHPADAERAAADATIAKAAAGLAAASRSAFELWRTCIDAVAVRATAEPGEPFSSGSIAFNARVSLLRNAHVPGATPAVVADALLHEALHSLLFVYEEIAGPFVTDARTADDARVVSPWSGRALPLQQFTHACLVWYGLYWFWTTARTRATWPEEESRPLVERARAGFANSPLAAIPTPCRTYLSAEIAETLDVINARMSASR